MKRTENKRKEKEAKKGDGSSQKEKKKSVKGIIEAAQKREPYIKAADSHLLERNNSCDTCQPL